VQENQEIELNQQSSERNMDSSAVTVNPKKNITVVQSEDEFEIQRRAFFGITYAH
jgi:hypothetical protein